MLNMTNRFYNQVKARLHPAAQTPENDIEQNVERPSARPVGDKHHDAREAYPLRQVVIDPPRDLPRPPSPRPPVAAPASHPPCPSHLHTLEEV